jgi:hypothetical protein
MARMIPKGSYAPMPALRKPDGTHDRKLPGGLPPQPYRNRNADWCKANKWARSDGSFIGTRLDCFHSTSEWDEDANKGKGRFVAP